MGKANYESWSTGRVRVRVRVSQEKLPGRKAFVQAIQEVDKSVHDTTLGRANAKGKALEAGPELTHPCGYNTGCSHKRWGQRGGQGNNRGKPHMQG